MAASALDKPQSVSQGLDPAMIVVCDGSAGMDTCAGFKIDFCDIQARGSLI